MCVGCAAANVSVELLNQKSTVLFVLRQTLLMHRAVSMITPRYDLFIKTIYIHANVF